MINEEFLHFIWKFQLFDFSNLQSVNSESILVFKPGLHNHNAGPDFLNAKIKLNSIIWFGDIELHVKSSDWLKHKHQFDENYNTVVLHVVFEDDIEIRLENGAVLPCLELKSIIPEKYLNEYDTLYNSISTLPCNYAIGKLDSLFWTSYSEKLLVERLESKIHRINTLFLDSKKDYQECFYQLLAYALGLKINADTMLDLAKTSPLLLLQKHRDNRMQVEAILYGQSGLLIRKYASDYPKLLQKEYSFFAQKYKLIPNSPTQWKFFRLRPSSFPSLRISQLADFVLKSDAIFEQLFSFKNTKAILPFFKLQVSDYWNSHYVFDKTTKKTNKQIGKSTLDLILINAVLPFCFFYARQKSDTYMLARVVEAYQSIKPEDNKIVRYFKEAKVAVHTAAKSQALIHLHDQYCIPRKCLNCRVFNQILK